MPVVMCFEASGGLATVGESQNGRLLKNSNCVAYIGRWFGIQGCRSTWIFEFGARYGNGKTPEKLSQKEFLGAKCLAGTGQQPQHRRGSNPKHPLIFHPSTSGQISSKASLIRSGH